MRLLVLLLVTACGTKYPKAIAPTKLTYADVEPIFKENCLQCHQPPNPRNGLDVTNEKQIQDFKDFYIHEIESDSMPPKKKLSKEDKEKLLKYLKQLS